MAASLEGSRFALGNGLPGGAGAGKATLGSLGDQPWRLASWPGARYFVSYLPYDEPDQPPQ